MCDDRAGVNNFSGYRPKQAAACRELGECRTQPPSARPKAVDRRSRLIDSDGLIE